MREGMKGKAGIGKLALYGREYLVAVQPRDNGLVMYTLRHAEGSAQHGRHRRARQTVPAKVKPDEIKLAKQVIENFEGELNLSEYRDEYQEELQRIIDAKIAGRGSRGDRGGNAAEGGQPDGRAASEPRPRQHRQEEGREGRVRKAGEGRPQEARGALTLRTWRQDRVVSTSKKTNFQLPKDLGVKVATDFTRVGTRNVGWELAVGDWELTGPLFSTAC